MSPPAEMRVGTHQHDLPAGVALITRFKQQIGVAPHMAARLVRLLMVWRHLDDEPGWARIAAECGYADQAHLIREFRRFTGTTPAALVAA